MRKLIRFDPPLFVSKSVNTQLTKIKALETLNLYLSNRCYFESSFSVLKNLERACCSNISKEIETSRPDLNHSKQFIHDSRLLAPFCSSTLSSNQKRGFCRKIVVQFVKPQPKSDRQRRKLHRKKVKRKMTESLTPNYEKAVEKLNSLQSNLDEKDKKTARFTLENKVKKVMNNLSCLNIEQKDLSAMNIIHISGTKGKGSTCAFVESILRRKGFKTGLFTSPHLVSVRERIQLDGELISEELFAKNFFHVYEKLKQFKNDPNNRSQEHDLDFPFYFHFLLLLALYTFKQQGCNVTILEVGIGGEFDCTNVVEHPAVVGVSSLGFDHVKILGNTLTEIAWNKAGIFKQNVTAFVSSDQKSEALEMLFQRASERNCSLHICPPLEEYQVDENRKIKLGISGDVQKLNASLALQICNHFINRSQKLHPTNNFEELTKNSSDQRAAYAKAFRLDEDYLKAMEECRLRGRCEVVTLQNNSIFYLDGAHTVESITHCVKWFKSLCPGTYLNGYNIFKILIFNCTGYRDYYQLLNPLLSEEKFNLICFTSNLITVEHLTKTSSSTFHIPKVPIDIKLKEETLERLGFDGQVLHFDCLDYCLKEIHVKNEINSANNLQTRVLACGSIHLIGGIISLLDKKYL